jgi:hypothetical protein
MAGLAQQNRLSFAAPLYHAPPACSSPLLRPLPPPRRRRISPLTAKGAADEPDLIERMVREMGWGYLAAALRRHGRRRGQRSADAG